MVFGTVAAEMRILLQRGWSSHEARVVAHHAMLADIPTSPVELQALEAYAGPLRDGVALPVGSVAFVRAAMSLAGIQEPGNLSYPEVLRPYLLREVRQREAGSVIGHWFVKPTATKSFTGFVFDTMANPDHLCEHDRVQYDAFMQLSPETRVWVGEPVVWQSEHRYYVLDGEILGEGRYDDGPEGMPSPDREYVRAMAHAMHAQAQAPVAFGLDVGVLESGDTALIECNDAWALGYYRGTLPRRDYVEMLRRRWNQLVCDKEASRD